MVVLLATLVAFAWPIQDAGWSQKAHYALVRSLADGTARIDAYHRETGDKAYVDGHFYSVKPPGLAFVSLPAYLALDAVDAVPGDDRTAIWILGLLTVVPFALLLCEATRRAAVRLCGGDGLEARTILAIGTIVLPFATLYFSHVPAAALAMCAALLALRAREDGRARTASLSGLCAGLAVLMEYPTAIVAGAILAYVAAISARRIHQVAAWLAGALVGIAPILLYNAWAFGSAARFAYGNVVDPSDWQSDTPEVLADPGIGVGWPQLRALADLLLSERGLLVTTPVLAVGLAGAIALARAGRRAESLLLGGTFAVALVWNSGLTTFFYGGPFGGDSPGPRYLLTVTPLALLAVGRVLRRVPGVVLATAAVSLGFMAVATATRPQVGADETSVWWDSLLDGRFTDTPLTLAGLEPGWIAILPFFAALAVLAGLAWRTGFGPLRPADAIAGAATVLAWLVVLLSGPRLLSSPGGPAGAALALLLLAAAVGSVVLAVRPQRTS